MTIHHLADKIIQVIKSLIDEQIIICDTNGIIIASTNPDKVGEYHEGSELVNQNNEQLIITKQLAMELKGGGNRH
ncbi:sugar diacid recognition domain-containing protein [Lentibacillus cibarius]|uniref:sugar diacid recognition domain-containing protein n=1 Tax=Lentibacillus cibarius TaxID=2583219 RepID=UPI0022793C2A|nr:sugar diacid recognition domain-containing protein [Lentibacillus cibarius]